MYICVFGSPPDPPNEPQFEYCISYNNGQPVLQVISHVRMYILCKLYYAINYYVQSKIVHAAIN